MNLLNTDCLEAMKQYKDNHFDLAIVDPPYGINQDKGISYGKYAREVHKAKNWDNKIPSKEYFEHLRRISKNQIIWGGNYFIDYLSSTRCMLVWDKKNGTNPMSDCELAWTSFDSSVRKFTWHHFSGYMSKSHKYCRWHPSQKPVALYSWILKKYAFKGAKILDTHLGSGSICIAVLHHKELKIDLTGFEIDEEYYNNIIKRINAFKGSK